MSKRNTQYSIRNTKNVYAVILVGGKGKRLRPLSTNARPKAFLSVTKDRKTMFRVTIDRISKIIPPKNILVSANKAHAALVKKDFPDINVKNLLLEPVSRNTAPAITLAVLEIKKRREDAVIAVVPADHYIKDEKKYLDSIKRGIEFAARNDCLILLGLKPTYPATGFGYIRVEGRGSRVQGIYKVEKFVEKPNLEKAKKFLECGGYFWNAGTFIFRAGLILEAIEKFAPAISDLARLIKKSTLNKLYKKFSDISIDYAVMEKAGNIYCVKGAHGWKDIGSPESIKEVLETEGRDFIMKNGKVVKIL